MCMCGFVCLADFSLCVRLLCLHVYLCTTCMSGAQGRQKKALDSPQLE